jgi:hypothetical protein
MSVGYCWKIDEYADNATAVCYEITGMIDSFFFLRSLLINFQRDYYSSRILRAEINIEEDS